MSSLIKKGEGMFNPSRRFAFTNITDEVFTSAWNGSPIVIKPGQVVELPHHLADKLTDELVDKIMIGEVAAEEREYKGENPTGEKAYYRSPRANQLGIPAARKVWEDRIVRELEPDEESPEIQVMRAQIREEILAEAQKEVSRDPVEASMPGSIGEFADLDASTANAAVTNSGEKPKKAPVRLKTVKE